MTAYSAPRTITAADDVSTFDCGEPSLNAWLRERSLSNQARDASRCVVTCVDGRVVGYYAIAAGSVMRTAAPKAIRESMPDPIPVIVLGRLAVDIEHQGHHLGEQLLRDAIGRSVAGADVLGAAALLVHCMDEDAREFYLRRDFVPSRTDPMHVMLAMKDARALRRGLWPVGPAQFPTQSRGER